LDLIFEEHPFPEQTEDLLLAACLLVPLSLVLLDWTGLPLAWLSGVQLFHSDNFITI